MSTPMKRVAILQVRLIGPRLLVAQLAPTLATAARTLLGTSVSYTAQTLAARRAGHVRHYLTVTRKENPPDDRHDA